MIKYILNIKEKEDGTITTSNHINGKDVTDLEYGLLSFIIGIAELMMEDNTLLSNPEILKLLEDVFVLGNTAIQNSLGSKERLRVLDAKSENMPIM